ncbi:MAG: magnesium transporter [Candidatus Anstonellales archaeon]
MTVRKHLEELRKVEREKHHPLIHKIHLKHKISKKTLLYVKEYGPHSNIPKTIIKESLKILLFTSFISSFGGLALEQIKVVFLSLFPLIVLLPTLNDMIGDYGIIVSSRFSTLLHTRKIRGKWYKNEEVKKLFMQVFVVAIITALISSSIALIISALSGFGVNLEVALKVFFISIIDVALIVSMLFILAILAGLYFYRKKEDPNNFLIPITTSFADFVNMLLLAFLTILLF